MAVYLRLAEALNDAANAWLPDPYVFGYHLAHDTKLKPDDPALADAPEDLAVLDQGCAEMLAIWRAELTRAAANGSPGASDDLAALPASGRYLLVEILHTTSGIRAVRCYSYATIRDLVANPNLTLAQKRAQIRNAIQNLYDTCVARVTANP